MGGKNDLVLHTQKVGCSKFQELSKGRILGFFSPKKHIVVASPSIIGMAE